MGIKRKITPIVALKKIKVEKTENKYIGIKDGVPFLDLEEVRTFLLRFPSPLIDGQHGVKRYISDGGKGLQTLSKILDLKQKVSEEKLENFITTAVSLYLFKEPNKFPIKIKDSKTSEDPDDMPPIDNALNEIGITTNDFKI